MGARSISGLGRRSTVVIALSVAACVLFVLSLGLWVGTPTGWNVFEAWGAVLGAGDRGAVTLARSRILELALLALAAGVQAGAAVLGSEGRSSAIDEAPGAFGATGASVADALGLGSGLGAASGALVGLASTTGRRLRGSTRRLALVAAAPLLFVCYALATWSSETAVWLRASSVLLGDVGAVHARDLLIGAAALALFAGALLAPAAVGRALAAAAQGLAAVAAGWFPGLAWVATRLAQGGGRWAGLGSLRTACAAAVVVLFGEALLAAASQPGRLPVAAITLGAAVALALARGSASQASEDSR
ncbi:hypothetical protein Pla163_19160 [Planctomycetes bacterium Pla163]|uniref:Uncharacterized protein n=1 Tax=Rohdeia mirabilis TaxID=2528008 RepID=A0A518D005_9BACT|nr:hypothetical protein Pla163_19160 [Planctomycetes bacterium Pla163]